MRTGFLILVSFSLTGQLAWSDELDAASTEALQKTQDLLKNPNARKDAISKNPNAQMVDQQVKALGGTDSNTEELYGLSSDVFEDVVKMTNGDAEQMQQLLIKAKNDPKAFYESLSDKNKAQFQEVSRKISNSPTMQQPQAK